MITGIESVVVGCINDGTDWRDVLKDCDVVIHLAARVHVMKDSVSVPLGAYREVNVDATMNFARQAVGLEVVITRPPLVYGSGVRANFLKLILLVKMGVLLSLGAIHNRRSIVALDNLVHLLITCTSSDRSWADVHGIEW